MNLNSSNNQQQLHHSMTGIIKQYNALAKEFELRKIDKTLLDKITKWEKESIERIQLIAKKTRDDLKRLSEQSTAVLTDTIDQLTYDLHSKKTNRNYTESDIKLWQKQLNQCQYELKKLSELRINRDDSSSLHLIKIDNGTTIEKETITSLPQTPSHSEIEPMQNTAVNSPSPHDNDPAKQLELSNQKPTALPVRSYPYPSTAFGLSSSTDVNLIGLFEHLRSLRPMDKNGTMSGNCDAETSQMETFLSQTFDFKNIRNEFIIPGVHAFRLDRPVEYLDPKMVVYFTNKTSNSFSMTVQEILKWQSSYTVYADKNVKGMTKEFLQKALQGQSEKGKEAFRMKFVVRISQCPILMEFDARIIPRKLEHDWPHRIKLVSVTGVDFAGRMHDLYDITTYVSNWEDIYEIDQETRYPVAYNGRDFHVKINAPQGQLHEQLLLNDLMRMARLRLNACDKEGVQVVVETGIGLGVFAGKYIGIDDTVRALSALAIRVVLEEDGPSYENIRAVVFALPIFDGDLQNNRREDVYQAFVDEFGDDRYKGSLPVLIADQDMHRLTVSIARLGFVVSELNPADSHGVFGEYWQNRGPAVEEKLALTTLGLLVQHHLINPYVLDTTHYYLV